MPGDTHMRDQTQDKDRRKFTSGLIRAIEELETRRIQRSPQQLADAAWQKLQYDFPLVETNELQALLEAFSASLVGKTGWPCYLLTLKALDNISSGARGAGSHAPPLTEQEQQVQQMLGDALTQRVLARSSSSGSSSQQAQQQQQQQPPVSQQQLYQQLAAVLLLQYAAKVASLPDQEAWQLMQAYCPEALQEPQQQHEASKQHQQQDEGAAGGLADIDAAIAAATAAASTAGHGGNSSCNIYDDTEAAEQDGDSDEYEPLEAAAHQSQLQHTHTHTPSPSQQDPRPFSWPALHQKLLSLAEHVHYSLFSCEPLWRQQGADRHLLQLLRLLGVHSHAQELQPLLHAYVGVLVDRLAAAPQDLPLLQQLWEALGLTAGSGLKQHPCSSTSKQQQQQGLYPEVVLGLSVAAAVWQQLPGGSARKQLWQLMHGHLLPLLESCAEQLAYSSNKSPGHSNSSGGAGAAGGACEQGTAFAHMLLLSHVLELLVLGRPGHVDVARQLTELGLTRSLVQLHCQWGCEVATEPLRRTLLLACCSSPHTTAWVLAVPTVKQQLQQQQLKLGGPFEAHGALWQLLLHPASSQPAKAPAATPPAASPPAAAGEAAQQQLLSLLQLENSNVQQLQRQVVALQLMVDAQKAAGSRQRLWGEAVLSSLRKLAAQLKEEGVAATTSEIKPAAATSKARLRSDSDSDSEHADGTAEAAGPAEQQRSSDMDRELEHRRSAQLQPTALRLVKELLTRGGKTD